MPAEYSIPKERRVMEHNPHKQESVLFQTSKQKGNWAENIACQWLVKQGLTLKQKNFYTRYGEIDLIMSDSSQLIFLEVKYRKNNYFRYQQALLIIIGLTVNPIISANIKKFTNIYCPAQLKIYSGNHDYHKIFYINQPDEFKNKKGQCFPAGHAVAGFSLFILFFVFQTRFLQISSLVMAILAGWIIGSYQMIKGDHFFGDTLISMLLCFMLSAIIARIFFTIKIKKINEEISSIIIDEPKTYNSLSFKNLTDRTEVFEISRDCKFIAPFNGLRFATKVFLQESRFSFFKF